MINKIVKIKPIPKKGGMHEFTLQSSLRKGGLSRVPGTTVNIEYDIVGKYIAKMIGGR